ncbi:hypothetical protein H310_08489 [Aphanomyces invadans]|uniref:Mediator of RNA polymerase II transcription subunit 4 n=1 Tax=Aphanomyces invadans TaxID=157072 RepID=A0A024TZF4_9STRA|nr:hypothetical protein H310_08489 [Aphanomyces invadans]ETV99016.1 hypothetical protein H310_08489 [Aphanomyces invadans]|eukprot:XP_008872444.1 hypothetical protein H310_08489 [Aphanomyces invadans]
MSSGTMRERVEISLNEHRFLTYKLLESLSHTSANVNPAMLRSTNDYFDLVVAKDKQLLNTVKQLNQHQSAQKELDALKAQIADKEQKIVRYAKELRSGQQSIASALAKHRRTLEQCHQDSSSKVVLDPLEVVAYAHKIAGSTSAPPNWKPEYPMFGFVPPAPTPEMMRAGVLSRGIIEATVTKESQYDSFKKGQQGGLASPLVERGISGAIAYTGLGGATGDTNAILPGWRDGDVELSVEALVKLRGPTVFAEFDIALPGHLRPNDPIPSDILDALRVKLDAQKKRKAEREADSPDAKKAKEVDSSSSSSDNDGGSDSSDEESEADKVQTIQWSLSDDEDDSD